jgi:NAD(P)-dependent dehydrogenase (short-subunit alcohol dehydrogenase family)
MNIDGAVAVVTGANRGLGQAYALALLERGAKKVYAGARDPRTVTTPGLTPLRLDITNAADIAAAAQAADDATIVINNAGIATGGSLLTADLDAIRADFETNVLGTVAVSRAFAPVLKANGGGALVNMLSVLSLVTIPEFAGYSASKAAEWSVTNGLRLELSPQGTLVVGVHAGFIDTDMAAAVDAPKISPQEVAAQTLDAILSGREEVFADELSRGVKAGLSGELRALYPALAG